MQLYNYNSTLRYSGQWEGEKSYFLETDEFLLVHEYSHDRYYDNHHQQKDNAYKMLTK